MPATAAVERRVPVLPAAYQYVPAHVIRRQPKVDVVELDIPTVYHPEMPVQETQDPRQIPLAPMRQSPTKGNSKEKHHKKRSGFESKKMSSWVSTTTSTTVFLPSATMQVRSVPELPPPPSSSPEPQRQYQDSGMGGSRLASSALLTSGHMTGVTQVHEGEGKKARASSFTLLPNR
ncbi:hypothetical protein LSM04_008618 [Trypanosoma melophagium]|uniref:uncharacterized protein n=1 Tax=Trypanosoma melophagium TaxID=715481 RepID=UPI00351A445B|nr:hypothetical protein LSM04_008618 [Trypanosoma melophagium]